MNEWYAILMMAVTGALFAAGGTHIDGIGGQKWLRRYLIPLFLAFSCAINDVRVPVYIGLGLILIVALSAGYGSKTPFWRKVLVFCSYSAPTLLIGFSWWVVITPVVLTLLFAASNWKPMASTVFWKSWEFIAGLLIALSTIGAIQNRWV